MASKTLTATLKLNTRQAENSLKRIDKLINNINSSTSKMSNIKGLEVSINTTTKSVEKLSKSFNATNSSANALLGTVKRLASTYLGVMGMKAMINTSDAITSAKNKLNNLNGGNAQLTQEQMDKMYVSANKVRMAYTDMLSNASKSMTLAGDAFQGNMDNAIRFQEIMAETYTLGGASAEEMSTSMYQLIQALGAGTLAGDELRSVREGAPLAYKAIEEYVQGVMAQSDATKKYATKSLKDIAASGLVTSEMVVAAIMDAGDRIDKQFDNTAITFAQAWNRIKSAAVKAFEPVSKMLNKMLTRAAESGAFEKLEQAFVDIAKGIQIAFEVIYNCISWIAENWEWLKYLLIAGLIAYATYLTITTGIAIAQAYARIAAWVAENIAAATTIATIYAGIAALILIFQAWKEATIDTCTAIVLALLVVATVCFIIFGWEVALIFAILALVVMLFGFICSLLAFLAGVIVDVLSFIWNIVVWLLQAILTAVMWLIVVLGNLLIAGLNALIQLVWVVADVIIGIIEFVLNCCNGGFNSFGDSVANLIGQIISWFLTLGKVVTQIIDAIFGTNWTAGLSSLQDKVLSWGKNENAITINRDAPIIPRMEAGSTASFTWDFIGGLHTGYVNPLEWGEAAYNWGSGVQNFVNEWGSQFQTGGSTGSWLDKLGKELGLDFSRYLSDGTGVDDVSGAYNVPSALDLINDALGDISDNTDKMVDLAEEDLEYLRKFANMEWKKEYTTASIKIDMTNNNSINGESDLDGIVTKLSEKLYEELNILADGVYT